MKLIQDEGAYRQLIQKFLAGRSTAGAFISSLSRLWKSDGAPVGGNSAVDADADTHPAITPGFYGLMDSVNSLCEDYTRCLPDGCGYRVSEEQFRHEIEALVRSGQAAFAARSDGSDRNVVGAVEDD